MWSLSLFGAWSDVIGVEHMQVCTLVVMPAYDLTYLPLTRYSKYRATQICTEFGG